jgi:hypothetical protein
MVVKKQATNPYLPLLQLNFAGDTALKTQHYSWLSNAKATELRRKPLLKPHQSKCLN